MSDQAALHLFIDTNVLLSFYATSNDDLEELRSISALIRARALKVYIPRQVQDEFVRNREIKLSASLNELKKPIPKLAIPRFMNGYDEIKAYERALAEAEKARSAAVARARAEATDKSIAADTLVLSLLSAAGVVEIAPQVLTAARRRLELGNPPGKNESLGDAVNWEHLLASVPNGSDVHIVSRDGDFASPLNKDAPRQFLFEEWKEKKNGKLNLHTDIRTFLQSSFAGIRFAEDIEKKFALERLLSSRSFTATHQAIALLKPLMDVLNDYDAQSLITAAGTNDQIYGIGTDLDVQDFFARLVIHRWDRLAPDEKFAFETFFDINPQDSDYVQADQDSA
jgi:predicted nucleic acid-binding protein